MARICVVTGKKTATGNNRPFSLKATRRTFKANISRKRIFNPLTGKVESLILSAKGVKTLKKWAKERFPKMFEAAAKVVKKVSAKGEGKHVHKEKKLTPKQKKELAAKTKSE